MNIININENRKGVYYLNEDRTKIELGRREGFPVEVRGMITLEMKFKIIDISSKGYMGNTSISVFIEDLDTGKEYRLTNRNLVPILEIYNAAIESREGYPTATFKTSHTGLNVVV